MTMKYIAAAALALSLSLCGTRVQASEASVDLGTDIQQIFGEIHAGNADWNQVVGRIDQLVARIDEALADESGDAEMLQLSRQRLLRAKARIHEQYLTVAHVPGESPINPLDVGADALGSSTLSDGTYYSGDFGSAGVSGGGGGLSAGGRVGAVGGGVAGSGVSGGTGVGGIGLLGSIAAAVAIAVDDNDNNVGIIASPSN